MSNLSKKVILGGLIAGLAIFLVSWAVNFVIQFIFPFDILLQVEVSLQLVR